MRPALTVLTFLGWLAMGCSNPSCPEGQRKIGSICHELDAGDGDDDDTERETTARVDAADGDVRPQAEPDGSDASDQLRAGDAASPDSAVTNAGPGGDASVTAARCASNNGGCDPRTTCAMVAGEVSCGPCPDGFSGDGASGCVQAPACSNNPCGPNSACAASAEAPGYSCSCKDGFKLQGSECVDIDECFEGTHACHMTAECQNRAGDYDCVCPLGYSGGTKTGFACTPRVVVGANFACALQGDMRVQCWGTNDQGQLGNGTQLAQATPVFVSGLDRVVAVAAHDSTSACALRDDGTVVCWGDNSSGQLGDGTTNARSTPAPVKNVSDAVAIASGGAQACAVLRDRSLRCWGDDGSGAATRTPASVEGLPQVVKVDVGFHKGCAVTATGAVWCWGADSTEPVQVAGLKDALHVSAGPQTACALRSDRSAVCWDVRAPEIRSANAISGAVSVAASIDMGYAVEADGEVRGWAGLPSANAEYQFKTEPIDASVVAAGGLGTPVACAAVADGTVRCWGINNHGFLGDGTTTSTPLTDGVFKVTTVTGLDLW